MPVDNANLELLYEDDFADFDQWHHEGGGGLEAAPGGGLRLHCLGSRQGGPGCMAFFRPTLPDQVAFEYDLTIRSHGGLVINYLAIRGLNGEDLIADRDKLPARTGVMRDYWSRHQGLQSYHTSVSRFNDKGEHTGTSNWRRNPGSKLCGHGVDPIKEIGRPYHVRVCKDAGSCQMYVNEQFAHGFIDWDQASPIPDTGKFGFRLIGSDVMADVQHFRVWQIEANASVWRDHDEPG